ncbi:MFS transporter [Micromonospora eburnea]|uniref:Drug resistance transporter, EmrB/QacA subfamily n=1 Tax=Micromonospora eburnea TaxID=227316 RepID=A0A1C6TS27_9ACTN|nr:MFS transporter [Micromonospora eburnea]SCL44590.1 drug resistance transporter, EmrB/QacA subfamily [Micromonospora eburnea]
MVSPAALPTVLAGIFMTILDFFIVNVAIPSTQRDLHASAAQIQWVVAGYGLAYGSGLILGGRLGDLAGRRRVFTVGLALFTLASVACGLAPNAGTLIAARVAQGASAALLAPQVLALLRTTYQGAAQVRAINAYALTMGLAAVFGQLIGGLLIHADLFGLGWRACFLINVPIGAAALALVRRVVPESRGAAGVRLDGGGALLVTAALVGILLPLIEGREQGWPWWTWLSFALAGALLVAYVRRRHDQPLIDPALFRERAFSAGLLTQLAFTMGMAAYFLIFALYAQQGRGLDALRAGLFFVPIGVGYLGASLAASRLVARYGRQVIAAGGLTRAVALAVLLVAVTGQWPVGWLVPALLVDGIGMGLALAPIMGTVLAQVAPRHAGAAAGVLTTAQQVGAAVGVGIIGIVFFGSLRDGVLPAFQHGLWYLIAVTAAIALLVQLLPRAAESRA